MKNKKVTHKQVCKFTEKFDNQCSDSWLTDILSCVGGVYYNKYKLRLERKKKRKELK